MAQAMINICIDEELKKNMEENCRELGLSGRFSCSSVKKFRKINIRNIKRICCEGLVS